MAKHRKGKHRPFSHRNRCTDNQIQLMSLLYTIVQLVGRSSAELTQGIVICVCMRRGLQDASVHMVKLLREDLIGLMPQRDTITIAMR